MSLDFACEMMSSPFMVKYRVPVLNGSDVAEEKLWMLDRSSDLLTETLSLFFNFVGRLNLPLAGDAVLVALWAALTFEVLTSLVFRGMRTIG